MKEKLQSILKEYNEQIEQQRKIIKELEQKIKFCSNHNLKEEERITQVKFDSVNVLFFRWNNMRKEIQELLNEWNA